MKQSKRVAIVLGILALVALVVLGIDALQRRSSATAEIPAGSIPLYLDGELLVAFAAPDLEGLQQTGFTDAEEGKQQQGWLLREVIRIYVDADALSPSAEILVISSTRDKQALLTWAEVDDPANQVLLALSNRGTLKLVSVLPALDTRDEWVQDVDRIEVTSP